jgi:hypothetical protein
MSDDWLAAKLSMLPVGTGNLTKQGRNKADLKSQSVLKQILRKESQETMKTKEEVYVDKLPPFFGSVEAELQKEHAKYDEMFRFPLNPAFY